MPIDHVNALPPGTRFEEYRLDAVLGAGGFGITYRAYDANLDKFVAIKEYLPGEFAARIEGNTVAPISDKHAKDYNWGLNEFLEEARKLARFDHPNLNKVHRYFETNATAYMVLEYIRGETLEERIRREVRLSEEAIRRLLEEVLSGLAVMHREGYVHRDIKPENLMMREEDGSAVVLDFGAARHTVSKRTRSISVILTAPYAPVEQYSEIGHIGPWTDIYALGMVAYRCISGLMAHDIPDGTGRKLAQQDGGEELVPAVEIGRGSYSTELLESIDWAIEVDKDARPQGVEKWRQALDGGGRVNIQPKPPETGVRQWTSTVLAALLVVLVGVGAWWGWLKYNGSDTGTEESAVAEKSQIPGAGVTDSEEILAEKIGSLLDDAEEYLQAARWNYAWQRYQLVLELDQANQDAKSGKERVIESCMEAFSDALERKDFSKARASLATIRELQPDSQVLNSGEQRLASAIQNQKDRIADENIARLLDAANDDLAALRLTTPPENNAWEKYESVLELDPANQDAKEGKERVINSYMVSFNGALEREEFDNAHDTLAKVRGLQPGSQELDSAEQRLGDARQKWITHLAGELVPISGGKFNMGSERDMDDDNDEKPPHSVELPDFMLGKYEVTVGQFRRFVEATEYVTGAERGEGGKSGCHIYFEDKNNSGWKKGSSWQKPGYAIDDNQPVVCVGWNDVMAFIKWLSEQTGETYRLPSESEWEYAARAGTASKYSFGDDEAELCKYANHADMDTDFEDKNTTCSDGVKVGAAVVGRYKPNSFELYDLHGNVWEWVQDCKNSDYDGAPTDGSAWEVGECDKRIVRGGSWRNYPERLRSANRHSRARSQGLSDVGFRLAQDK